MINLHFTVDEQNLSVEKVPEIASNLVGQVTCSFDFNGEEWDNYDAVKAVFWNKAGTVEELLIYDNGQFIPHELLEDKGKVYCNLVACSVEDEELVERYTSYKCECLNVTYAVVLEGENEVTPTPSAYEQYVAMVKGYRDDAKGYRDEAKGYAEDIEGLTESIKEDVLDEIEPTLTAKQDKLIAGTNIVIASDGKTISAVGALTEVDWEDIENKPSTFPPSTHTHNQYVEKEIGKSLISDDEIARLSTVHNYDDSSVTERISTIEGKESGWDAKAEISDVPTKVSELENDKGYLTEHQDISGKVDKEDGKSLISDTEIARLADVHNYDDTTVMGDISALYDAMEGKVDKVDGKGLSSNDYTDTEKTKLSGIEDGANKYVLPSDVVKDASYVHTDNNFSNTDKSDITTLKSDITRKQDKLTESDKQAIADMHSDKVEDVKVNGVSVVTGKTANIDLSDYAKLGKITVTMIGSQHHIPTGNNILIYEVFPDGNKLVKSIPYGTEAVTVSLDDGIEYIVTGSITIDGFYNPTQVKVDLYGTATATVEYYEAAPPTTMSDVHTLISLGLEEQVMSVGDEINVEWEATNGTKYTAPAMVMHLGDNYTRHSDGESVKGVRFQFKYGFPDVPAFDREERERATEETALANTYYYGTNNNSTFALLSYAEGDTIDYSAYTYIYHNSFKDTTCNIIKYGNNLIEYSAYLQWLNSVKSVGQWWASTHLGDSAPTQANTIRGFMAGFNGASWLDYVLDEDFTVAQNTVIADGSMRTLHAKFRPPMLVEMYGSPQKSGEGDNHYWEGWKQLCNNSEVNPISSPGNGSCGARRIRNLENASYSTSFLASCYRNTSCLQWYTYGSDGNLDVQGVNVASRSAPAFVIY